MVKDKAKLEQLVSEFAKDSDIIATVKRIEAKPATTKGHYGDYMAALSTIAPDVVTGYVIALSLVRAGADKFGVESAFRIQYNRELIFP